jgi:spermidine synthase
LRPALYALFAISGFAGLIYESIWTHYLKLFLGHAAYAQTLVLVIFMGGMALGAWLAGEFSRRLAQPLKAYLAIELTLGALGLVFDPVFRAVQAWCFDHGIPALESPAAIDLLKWGVSSLLILPQCVLLGSTFPIMSAALVRQAPQDAGRALGWLYFTNSLGAAVGVVVSGFVLVSAIGLPGTMLTAALLNFLLGGGVWLILGWSQPPAARPAPPAPAAASLPLLLLAVAFFTGSASFFYEIGWIRMLSLVLGSATHSFELMLSAFILGLALGSFWIRNRVDGLADARQALAWIQIVMGTLALASLVSYGWSFGWMAAILGAVQRSDGGYVLFNLFSHGICMVLMLPVTFCAGMTLPLITAMLLRTGYGERAIGRVYAANTLGAIVGVVAAVHLVLPVMGLRAVVLVGAAIDVGVGLWLLQGGRGSGRFERVAIGVLVAAGAAVAMFVHFDPAQLSSGVYRDGVARQPSVVQFHQDGKTASVDVILDPDGTLAIATNGKVDAGLNPNVAGIDDYTMILLAALPVAMHPDVRDVAVIGLGSGRTTHALLGATRIERVDTIEIEPAIIAGARRFGPMVRRTFDDPRSTIYVEDAKTFFSRSRRQYDVIVSEPSNPWVSGVASLFGREFYGQVRRSLKPGGMFVQWLHLYHMDVPLASTVMRALDEQFDDYLLFTASDLDLIVVASPSGALPPLRQSVFAEAGLGELLAWLQIRSLTDLQLRIIGGRTTMAPLFASYGLPVNSDYFPVLDQNALKRRFKEAMADELHRVQEVNLRLHGLPPGRISPVRFFTNGRKAADVQALADHLRGVTASGGEELIQRVEELRRLASICGSAAADGAWFRGFTALLEHLPYFDDATLRATTDHLQPRRCSAPREADRWVSWMRDAGTGAWSEAAAIAEQLAPAAAMPDRLAPALARELVIGDFKAGQIDRARLRLQKLSAMQSDQIEIRHLIANLGTAP